MKKLICSLWAFFGLSSVLAQNTVVFQSPAFKYSVVIPANLNYTTKGASGFLAMTGGPGVPVCELRIHGERASVGSTPAARIQQLKTFVETHLGPQSGVYTFSKIEPNYAGTVRLAGREAYQSSIRGYNQLVPGTPTEYDSWKTHYKIAVFNDFALVVMEFTCNAKDYDAGIPVMDTVLKTFKFTK